MAAARSPMEERQPKKYASEIERRRKPLKDVDATARVQLLKGFVWVVPVGFLFSLFTIIYLLDRGDPPLAAVARGFAIGLGGILLVYGFLYIFVIGGLSGLLGKLYGGGSAGTPLPSTYWRAQALAARGAAAEALQSLELEAKRYPDDPGPCLRAAALCVDELADPESAIAWYHRARNTAKVTPETDAYVAVRLAELYESLDAPGRAMTELRRLLERHPRSGYAVGARARLAALKARQVREREAGQQG